MFNNVVYINMDTSIDRRAWAEAQFKEHNVNAERFSAIHTDFDLYCHDWKDLNITDAQVGCLLSHLEVIRRYGENDLLVFEDDIDLTPMGNWGFTFEQFVERVPSDVPIVQLVKFPNFYPLNIKKWYPGMFSTAAYFIRKEYVSKLISLGFHDGKWGIKKLKSSYVQPLADSILYSNGEAQTATIFALGDFKSQIIYVGPEELGPGGAIRDALNNINITLDLIFQ